MEIRINLDSIVSTLKEIITNAVTDSLRQHFDFNLLEYALNTIVEEFPPETPRQEEPTEEESLPDPDSYFRRNTKSQRRGIVSVDSFSRWSGFRAKEIKAMLKNAGIKKVPQETVELLGFTKNKRTYYYAKDFNQILAIISKYKGV